MIPELTLVLFVSFQVATTITTVEITVAKTIIRIVIKIIKIISIMVIIAAVDEEEEGVVVIVAEIVNFMVNKTVTTIATITIDSIKAADIVAGEVAEEEEEGDLVINKETMTATTAVVVSGGVNCMVFVSKEFFNFLFFYNYMF